MTIVTTARLAKGAHALEIHTEVEQHAEDHRLQVVFPTPFQSDRAAFDGHFEIVCRPLRLPQFDGAWIEEPRPEAPQRSFTAVEDSASRMGLVIANRGLREASVVEDTTGHAEIALTLLRCVGWLSRGDLSTRRGDAGPRIETPGAQMPGKWSFDYAIIPYAPGQALQAYHQAYAFNAPARVVTTGLHAGPLPATLSFVRADRTDFIISTIKAAEDDRAWIVRGYSVSDEPTQVKLSLWKPFVSVERCNMAETPQEPLKLSAENVITLALRPHEIVSIRLS
jgi:alpha-mannosidase